MCQGQYHLYGTGGYLCSWDVRLLLVRDRSGVLPTRSVRIGRIFFGQTFDLEIFAWINFVWIIENK